MFDERLDFKKVRDVKSPERAHAHDAGIDFFVPYYDMTTADSVKTESSVKFIYDLRESNPDISINVKSDQTGLKIILNPGQRVKIPSGIHVIIYEKYSALIANNKSGIATKLGLIFGASTVDADYTGEIGLCMINASDKSVIIESGQKIVQFIHTPVILSMPNEVTADTYDEILKGMTIDRGTNGFGSQHTVETKSKKRQKPQHSASEKKIDSYTI